MSSKKTSVTSFLSGLESSGWLKHVRSVLEAGVFIAEVQSQLLIAMNISDLFLAS